MAIEIISCSYLHESYVAELGFETGTPGSSQMLYNSMNVYCCVNVLFIVD